MASRHYIHEAKDGTVTFMAQAKAIAKRRKEGGYIYHATQGWMLVERDPKTNEYLGRLTASGHYTLEDQRAMQRLHPEACEGHRIEMSPKRKSFISDFVGFAQLEQAQRVSDDAARAQALAKTPAAEADTSAPKKPRKPRATKVEAA